MIFNRIQSVKSDINHGIIKYTLNLGKDYNADDESFQDSMIEDIAIMSKIKLDEGITLLGNQKQHDKMNLSIDIEYKKNKDHYTVPIFSVIGMFQIYENRTILNMYNISTHAEFQGKGLLTYVISLLQASSSIDGIMISQFYNVYLAIHLGLNKNFTIYNGNWNVIDKLTLQEYKDELSELSRQKGRFVNAFPVQIGSRNRRVMPEYALWLQPVINQLVWTQSNTRTSNRKAYRGS